MKLSIITVCFNSEKTIEKTIQSVISQKTADIEYIIIDGASSDGTLEIIKKYAEQIDIIVSEKDQGISDAFNKGIRRASGDYIGIINSDDQYLKGAFERFFSEVSDNTDVFFGNGVRINEKNLCKKYMSNPDPNGLKKSMSIMHSATFVRKSAYEKYGMYSVDYKYVMDRECLLRMLNNGARFQYSERFFSLYSMGGLSEKGYITGVAPESYRIDIANGISIGKAFLRLIKRYFKWYAIKIKKSTVRDDGVPLENLKKELEDH